ncbi:type II toxin-antitoxin system antitoxin MazE [Staphylococcus delphini]|uniref:type II toxin-antitoxin system antitoxin MazE n=1 Tax=Staphylococcus delphini TaxID=53344 RepID=UPI0012D2FDA1|nr:type II toxin-antitoxin system antitoxin MazE [Staphylococcus delphini]MTV19918.1 antitoxin MazE [Staphylococcus delphini]
MSAFNQTRFKNLEQSLKEGYVQMADLNLSLATEAYPVECEACDCNESHLTTDFKED